jgi:hypothetical protein
MISKAAAGLSQLCQISPTHIIFADFEVVVKCNVCVYSRLYYRAGWMWQVGECKDFHN